MSNICAPARLRQWSQLPVLALLTACAVLAGCQSRTNVSATGNTAAQFTHVFLTVNQIWFNPSATAAPSDTTWAKFTLATPQSIDLVSLSNGTLAQFASELKLTAGTYNQVMLVFADSTDTLTAAAHSAGAATNDEVDYLDADDVAHTVPLAVLNAARGIGIATSLTVAAAATTVGGSSSSRTSSTASSTSTSSSTFAAPVVTTTTALIDFDATRDLVPISLGGQPAFAFNPHPSLYNVKHAGSIQGAVSLTGVSTLTTAGLPDVQVAAEALSSDGSRHVVVKTTRVASDGSFTLYPLSTASGAPGTYDLVIHGPTIQTVIIKSVPITNAAPGSAAAVLGTLTLTAATPFLANLNSASPASPTSSVVGFYQTLPLSSEVPYLIEWRPLDPVSGIFASDQELSGGALQYGTYVSGTIALTAANPAQGAATYAIGAINPAYGAAAMGTTVSANSTTTTTALFTVDAPPVPTGSVAAAIRGTVSVSSSSYDRAELFLTHGGALVAAAPLNSYLTGSQGTLDLLGVAPGGSSGTTYAAGVYNAEVWAWHSSDPAGTLIRSPYSGTIDMSAGDATGVSLSVP
jgi:Domain of unknown function (DUF4382)